MGEAAGVQEEEEEPEEEEEGKIEMRDCIHFLLSDILNNIDHCLHQQR